MVNYNYQFVWKLFPLDNVPFYDDYFYDMRLAFRNRENVCEIVSKMYEGKAHDVVEDILKRCAQLWHWFSEFDLEESYRQVFNTFFFFDPNPEQRYIDRVIGDRLYEAVNMTTDHRIYLRDDYKEKLIEITLDRMMYTVRNNNPCKNGKKYYC